MVRGKEKERKKEIKRGSCKGVRSERRNGCEKE